ncbi:uncharacterized protein LOC106153786 [Lingula anatina]|uniref:Uncharacterized protein LOC106153786 n=1 Tax=Lingula anatina TaxID=7574 RepID=A0A1S3HBE8_LINAN|nr:uncharacterized protein LOC106153786 [Lingula anatina]|eukprot:XP_013383340.1 uncharacterized protein LOC106153786 [Lingula anatina]
MNYNWRCSCVSLWLFHLFVCTRTGAALMCVSCDSTTDPLCEARPPPPINCSTCIARDIQGNCIPGMENKFCMIVREIDENGTQLTFSRSCSPFYLSSFEYCQKGVTEIGPPRRKIEIQVCYQSCAEDGCNRARSLGNTWLWYFSVIVTLCFFSTRS